MFPKLSTKSYKPKTEEVSDLGYFVSDGTVFASIQIDRDGAVLVASTYNSKVHELCLFVQPDGIATLQVAKGDQVRHVDLFEMLGALEKLGVKVETVKID